jgi:hypothetical protein
MSLREKKISFNFGEDSESSGALINWAQQVLGFELYVIGLGLLGFGPIKKVRLTFFSSFRFSPLQVDFSTLNFLSLAMSALIGSFSILHFDRPVRVDRRRRAGQGQRCDRADRWQI